MPASSREAVVAVRPFRAPPGQIPKHCMQLIDQPGPLRRDVRAPLIQQGKHRGDVLGDDRISFPLQCSDASRRSCIDHIILAPSTAGQSRTRAVAVDGTS